MPAPMPASAASHRGTAAVSARAAIDRKGGQEADQRDMLALSEVVHRQDQEDGGRHREQRPAGDAAQDAGAVESAPGQP